MIRPMLGSQLGAKWYYYSSWRRETKLCARAAEDLKYWYAGVQPFVSTYD